VIVLRHVWRGVNAPVFPLCLAGFAEPHILGFSIGELLYLLAVAILWYLVGRFIDGRPRLQVPKPPRPSVGWIVRRLLLVAWGTFLFAGTIWIITDIIREVASGNALIRPDDVIVCSFFLLWSLTLIALPGLRLMREIRPRGAS
jgi:hypothetical protein